MAGRPVALTFPPGAGGLDTLRLQCVLHAGGRPGDLVQGAATLDASFGTGCVLPTVTAATSAPVLASTATRNPLSQGYWGTHSASAELLDANPLYPGLQL